MLQTKTEAGAFFFFFELLGVSNLECGRNCVLRCVWDVHSAHIYWASIMCQSESERESRTQIPSLSALPGEASLKSGLWTQVFIRFHASGWWWEPERTVRSVGWAKSQAGVPTDAAGAEGGGQNTPKVRERPASQEEGRISQRFPPFTTRPWSAEPFLAGS